MNYHPVVDIRALPDVGWPPWRHEKHIPDKKIGEIVYDRDKKNFVGIPILPNGERGVLEPIEGLPRRILTLLATEGGMYQGMSICIEDLELMYECRKKAQVILSQKGKALVGEE